MKYLTNHPSLPSSITSILFPIFASYKALRTSDPSLLVPWLMYWTTLSLFLLVESQLYFILYWIPFYAWIRLGIHLYLVLPGKQGSVYIYKTHIHPFLEEHERQIDQMISDGHAKLKAAGLDAMKRGIEYIRVQILGQQPSQPTPPTSRNVSYSSALMSRFSMPAARDSLAAAAGTSDLFSMLGKAMQQTSYPTSTTREAQVADITSSQSFIPPNLSGAERTDFVNTQRDRLRTLLQVFEQEATPIEPFTSSADRPGSSTPRQPSSRKPYLTPNEEGMDGSGSGYMHKSRSESEFEDLAYEPMPDPDQFRPSSGRRSSPDMGSARTRQRPARNGSWSNWVWGNYGEQDSAARDARKDR